VSTTCSSGSPGIFAINELGASTELAEKLSDYAKGGIGTAEQIEIIGLEIGPAEYHAQRRKEYSAIAAQVWA
jgi:hypothetical protein